MKTILASSLVIATLTLNLTSTWLGGFGLPAWVAGVCLVTFVAGLIMSERDYRRILK